MRGFKAGYAYDGRDYKVRIGQRAAGDGARCAVDYLDACNAGLLSCASSSPASSSVAIETIRGRQRTVCAKASSRLRPAASAATA